MTKTQSTVISVKGDDFIQKEALSNEVISPGHLLEIDEGSGNLKKLTADISALAEFTSILIALENSILGEGVEDAWASGDTVKYAAAKSGQEFLIRVKTSANNFAAGARLVSDGGVANGTVKPIEGGATTPQFIAKEAYATTASEVLILAEVI